MKEFYEKYAVPLSDEAAEQDSEGHEVMPEEAWLLARQFDFSMVRLTKEAEDMVFPRYSICASEADAVIGVSPWKSSLELFHEKRGDALGMSDVPKNEDALRTGHAFEGAILELLEEDVKPSLPAMASALSGYPEWMCADCSIRFWTDKRMFVSRQDPFMLADPDGFCTISTSIEGQAMSFNGYVEIKTVSGHLYDAQKAWKEGLVPPTYEAQCLHAMHVFGADFTIISAAWGLQKDFRTYRFLTRDMQVEVPCFPWTEGAEKEEVPQGIDKFFFRLDETGLIKEEKAFLQQLEEGREPEEGLKPLLQNEYYARLYGATVDKEVDLSQEEENLVLEIAETDEKIRFHESEIEVLNERREAIIAKLYPSFGKAGKASFVRDGHEYVLTCKAGFKRPTFDYEGLKKEHPDVFQLVADEAVTYKLNSKAKTKANKEIVDRYRHPGKPNGERKWKLVVKDA